MDSSSEGKGPLGKVLTSPWLLLLGLLCLALLAKCESRALLLPRDWRGWLAVLAWGICLLLVGVAVLAVGKAPSGGEDDMYRPPAGAAVRITAGLFVIGVGAVLLMADVAMVVARNIRLANRFDWYLVLSLSALFVLITYLDATGRIKSKRWRRFLFGDSWWERRKKRKQNRR